MESGSLTRACLLVSLAFILIQQTSAQCMLPWSSPSGWGGFTDVESALTTIGASLALLMLAMQGMKWIMAEGAEEREDAKRGIIYIFIGLILLYSAYSLVYYLLCP